MTCYFIANQLAALDLADRGEQRPDLLLSHRLRQVIHDQIRLTLIILRYDMLNEFFFFFLSKHNKSINKIRQ